MIFEDFDDKDIRDDYEIKKVSFPLLKRTVRGLRKQGRSYKSIWADTDAIVDRLEELKPDIRKESFE